MLWGTREQAMQALQDSLVEEGRTIYRGFAFLDEIIGHFESASTSMFVFVTGLTVLKARNLAQGCLSLTLDGLAQEAGALLRPMIETLELITYFREDPTRIDEAVQGRLPPAGVRAQRIRGRFKNLREHLNEHASHFSFTLETLRHLFSWQDIGDEQLGVKWKLSQSFSEQVFRTNLQILFLFLTLLILEGTSALGVAGLLTEEMADRAEAFRDEGFVAFGIVTGQLPGTL